MANEKPFIRIAWPTASPIEVQRGDNFVDFWRPYGYLHVFLIKNARAVKDLTQELRENLDTLFYTIWDSFDRVSTFFDCAEPYEYVSDQIEEFLASAAKDANLDLVISVVPSERIDLNLWSMAECVHEQYAIDGPIMKEWQKKFEESGFTCDESYVILEHVFAHIYNRGPKRKLVDMRDLQACSDFVRHKGAKLGFGKQFAKVQPSDDEATEGVVQKEDPDGPPSLSPGRKRPWMKRHATSLDEGYFIHAKLKHSTDNEAERGPVPPYKGPK